MFVAGKIMWHALKQSQQIPPKSEAESKQATDWRSAKLYAEWREDHDPKIQKAFGAGGHPYFFEQFAMFAGHLFDEPPSDEEMRQTRMELAEAARQRTIDRLNSMWSGPTAPEPETE